MNVSYTDHCGQCGLPLVPAPLGGTYQCCTGASYWTKHIPRPRDYWARMPEAKYGNWRLYASSLLPLDTVFIQPRFHHNGSGDSHG